MLFPPRLMLDNAARYMRNNPDSKEPFTLRILFPVVLFILLASSITSMLYIAYTLNSKTKEEREINSLNLTPIPMTEHRGYFRIHRHYLQAWLDKHPQWEIVSVKGYQVDGGFLANGRVSGYIDVVVQKTQEQETEGN